MIGIIYLIGCFIALLLGIRILYKEECNSKEKEIQYGMLAPLTLMSWISVFLILWEIRDELI
jgi:hypothetical protein